MTLEIVYETDDLIAINKPHGLLVHRTPMAQDATSFALQILRDQIKQRVYPVHRLDRKTSGVLLFAKTSDANQAIQKLFREQAVKKRYTAIVRGFCSSEGLIDYPLRSNNKLQDAKTNYKLIKHFEIPFTTNKFPSSRYSLLSIMPQNGRFHQIRKHFAHIFHPIIGDRPHGCNKQNKFWKDVFGLHSMMLHAAELELTIHNTSITINADLSSEFKRVLNILTQQNMIA